MELAVSCVWHLKSICVVPRVSLLREKLCIFPEIVSDKLQNSCSVDRIIVSALWFSILSHYAHFILKFSVVGSQSYIIFI